MREEFLALITELSDLYNSYKIYEGVYEDLTEIYHLYGVNFVNVKIEEFDEIVNNIDRVVSGDISCLNDYNTWREYFKKILDKFESLHNCRRDWRYIHPERYSEMYNIEEDIMYDLKNILDFMNESPFDLFQIIRFEETVNLRNVCCESHLPYDIERYVSDFIGVRSQNI